MEDWRVAQEAEGRLKGPDRLAAELGLAPDEYVPMGRHVAKLEAGAILERRPAAPAARYVVVTAVTPTPLGEGKSTATLGLVQGMGALGLRAMGAIRQPSGGPTFNIKGSAAGGGRAQCAPRDLLSLGLTGDMDAVTNANNLAMTALTARMRHEARRDDARLARSGLRRLSVDPARIELRWAIDFCAQALRRVTLEPEEGSGVPPLPSGFQMTSASEVMAILSLSRDLADLRARLGRMAVARGADGRPITARDLEVDGAMAALLVRAFQPNLLQTLEGQPVLVHAGPFANIAVGQNSVVADRVGSALADYLVTESGFAAEIGFEKFWNIKCRATGLAPHAAVVVATLRALKRQGGAPRAVAGRPLPPEYAHERPDWVEKGCANLAHHLGIVRQAGVTPVVCLNRHASDHASETAAARRAAEAEGAVFVVSDHWARGGEGARGLAEAVAHACRTSRAGRDGGGLRYLYSLDDPVADRVDAIARHMYGADGVDFAPAAGAALREIEADPEARRFPVCMAKTQYSLSHDPALAGAPRGWRLPVREVAVYRGAGLIVPVAGDIQLLPGTGSDPAFRRVDVDVATGRVTGLV